MDIQHAKPNIIFKTQELEVDLLVPLVNSYKLSFTATELMVKWTPILQQFYDRKVSYIDIAKIASVLSRYLTRIKQKPATYLFERDSAVNRLAGKEAEIQI